MFSGSLTFSPYSGYDDDDGDDDDDDEDDDIDDNSSDNNNIINNNNNSNPAAAAGDIEKRNSRRFTVYSLRTRTPKPKLAAGVYWESRPANKLIGFAHGPTNRKKTC